MNSTTTAIERQDHPDPVDRPDERPAQHRLADQKAITRTMSSAQTFDGEARIRTGEADQERR